jgi:hypothetical protein
VRAYARTEYAGCRLQTGRKASFKAVLGIYASVTGTRQLSLPSDFGDDVIVKRNSYDVCELVGSTSKLFKLSEEGDVAVGASPVGAVLRSEAAVRYKEHKKINNKIICKGDLLVSSLYVRENDEIEQASFEFPFSQIVDIEGITEDSDCDVRFTVCDIMSVLSDSMDGSKNIIEYDITMSASAIATKSRQIELITDAFHVGYETLGKPVSAKTLGATPGDEDVEGHAHTLGASSAKTMGASSAKTLGSSSAKTLGAKPGDDDTEGHKHQP